MWYVASPEAEVLQEPTSENQAYNDCHTCENCKSYVQLAVLLESLKTVKLLRIGVLCQIHFLGGCHRRLILASLCRLLCDIVKFLESGLAFSLLPALRQLDLAAVKALFVKAHRVFHL